jgi:hypothetical protein
MREPGESSPQWNFGQIGFSIPANQGSEACAIALAAEVPKTRTVEVFLDCRISVEDANRLLGGRRLKGALTFMLDLGARNEEVSRMR